MKYTPKPINTDDIQISDSLTDLIEILAKDVHEKWALGRMADGWQYGAERDDQAKLHPCLVPYEELPESEKEYDRNTVKVTLKLVQKLGYEIRKK